MVVAVPLVATAASSGTVLRGVAALGDEQTSTAGFIGLAWGGATLAIFAATTVVAFRPTSRNFTFVPLFPAYQ